MVQTVEVAVRTIGLRLPDVNPGAVFLPEYPQRSLAKNARFPPLAEIPTAQPCQWVAEKVSLVPLACSVSEGVDYSRPSLQVNGTRPRLCTTNRSYNKFIVHSPLILTPAPDPNKLGGIGIPSP